jgi:hypothetical protein
LDRLATLAQKVWGRGWAGWNRQVSDTERLRALPETFRALDEMQALFRQQITELVTGRTVWLDRREDISSADKAQWRTSYLAVMLGVLNYLETALVVSGMHQIHRLRAEGRIPIRRRPSRAFAQWLAEPDEDDKPALVCPAQSAGTHIEGPPDAAGLEELWRKRAERRAAAGDA